jgi:hypothetical protein
MYIRSHGLTGHNRTTVLFLFERRAMCRICETCMYHLSYSSIVSQIFARYLREEWCSFTVGVPLQVEAHFLILLHSSKSNTGTRRDIYISELDLMESTDRLNKQSQRSSSGCL